MNDVANGNGDGSRNGSEVGGGAESNVVDDGDGLVRQIGYQRFAKDVYIELAAFSDSIYERGKATRWVIYWMR